MYLCGSLSSVLLSRQVGWFSVWCDGGEGTGGGDGGWDGTRLSAGRPQEEDLHYQASEDELLQAVAGGAVPAGPDLVQTRLPDNQRPWWGSL